MNTTTALGRRRAGLAVALLALALPAALQAQSRQLGIDVSGMDRTVRPQDDFNQFVNGGWIRTTEIPADRARYGSFDALSEQSTAAVRTLIEGVAARTDLEPGSEAYKIGALYRSFMDTVRIEQLGVRPLEAPLAIIASLESAADLPRVLGELAPMGVRGPFAAFVGQDPKNSSVHIVSAGQSGLGLPDRDYYLREDARLAQMRSAYGEYIARLFTLAGQPDPEGSARRILALETRIAELQWDRAKLRDRNLAYNKMTVAELAARAPGFDWAAWLEQAGMGSARELVVRQPDYFTAVAGVVAETPVATWREYLTLGLLTGVAPMLTRDFVETRFEFYGRTLSGQQELEPRWKRGVAATQGALGEAVGKLYVEKHFQPAAKARMDELVKNLRAAFQEGIEELEWMSPATRAQAQEKLAKFTVKIGYPDKWRDYSALEIRADDLAGNQLRAARFGYDDMVGRLGQPVDRDRWGMTPQTVNAYYNSSNNEIVFPAAILQPPFFNVEADDAVNYGGIGAVIGHEISHGFDDQGRKSDGDGNLRDWWTAEDEAAFQERTKALGAQYAAYTPIEGMHINPGLTMGENIGDLSGLAVAYRAYRNSLQGQEAPVIDGFTGDQRFFMGWAQVWRTKMLDDELRRRLLTDSHSPGMYRAFVSLTNMDAFYEAFDVNPGDGMYRPPEERVRVW
ncbi:MAG TPA: M13-type metalloendopeptidase [Longimicrobiales bacterium]|nr:M13-type metalloendopeptidase [Longimicrobiales bacterium]